MTTLLSAYDNSWYKPGHPAKRLLWMIVSAVFFQHPLAVGNTWKCFLLKIFGAEIGKNVVIKPSVTIKYPWFLTIADYSWLGERVWIDNLTAVVIGKHCCISQGALLLTGNHNYKSPGFDLMLGTITLENGVWIGAGSVVCPGVVCHSHSVLSVGSVASGNLEPYYIYRGNPALKIKKRIIES